MMNKQIAGIVLAASMVAGVGMGALANALTSETPSEVNPRATAPSGASQDAADFEIQPGAVGPVHIGMSTSDAVSTGFFDADVASTTEGCPTVPLAWKKQFAKVFDVHTLGNGEIVSIGIWSEGPITDTGLGVGSTYDEVAAVYPDDSLVETGYGQSGVSIFDSKNGGWIGFLFDPAPDAIEGSDRVTFVEVTKGSEPSLMRDGC